MFSYEKQVKINLFKIYNINYEIKRQLIKIQNKEMALKSVNKKYL